MNEDIFYGGGLSTYRQLEQRAALFLASNEHNVLRTAVVEGSNWLSIGVPSALRRTLEAIGTAGPASFVKVIWVKLPYERKRGWTLRVAQRRVAEEVLGVAPAMELMDGADEDDEYSDVEGVAPAMELMDGADEDDEYSDVEVDRRGIVTDVSRQIAEELTRIGRFLLVIENWWEKYSPELEGLGIPIPNRWSSGKVILWDPFFRRDPIFGWERMIGWLLLQRPSAGDLLDYVYREAVDVADVLNSKSDIAMVTQQTVLDSLLFTSLLFVDEGPRRTHPFRQSKSEIVQFWVQNGLIMAHNVSASGRRAAASHDDDLINITTAEALVEELLHRRLLLYNYSSNVVAMFGTLLRWMLKLASSGTPTGYQDFQPRRCVILRDAHSLGNLKEPENVQGLSIVHSRLTEPPPSLGIDDGGGTWYAKLCNLRTLIFDGPPCFPADDFFSKMYCLRVLLIYRVKVESLPNSLFCLPNLRMLLLRDCESLNSFFIPGAPTTALHGLRVLELSGSQLNSIDFLMAAPNLKKLLLSHCSQLKILQPNLYCHSALEELRLHSCPALQEVDIEFKMPMLQHIHLSGSPAIRRLSFTGCNKLEVIELDELQNLESLDLSATAIKHLHQCTFPSKSLIFLGANNLRTFPWKTTKQLPKELILDQHVGEASSFNKEFDLTQQRSHDGGGVWMHVYDGRFFRMLCDPKKGAYSQLESSFPQHFHINITPSAERGKKAGITSEFVRRVPSQYGCIQVHPKILQKQSFLCRHVEIQGSHPSPRDIHALLKNTLSLSLSNLHSYKSSSELMPIDSVVKQFQIEKCHGMEAIFECSAYGCPLQSLESVWASELGTAVALAVEKGRGFNWPQGFKDLKHVHLEKGRGFNWPQGFKDLKHVHLEYCPKLRYVFPPGARHGLQSLEVLEILFCTNLQEVFAAPSQESRQAALLSSSPTLPFAQRLRIVHLLQLPCLLSVCHEADTYWPALERFKVRGCWRLRKLPFLTYSPLLPATRTVTIDGEPV